ncbi:MAG: NAD(P) transhydrogenase subunit alpha [Alphaproteobacteria bacterium]|nr:NAD(P) transhydrogenase subunit alpha [Alphaproteobacteria bacterium]
MSGTAIILTKQLSSELESASQNIAQAAQTLETAQDYLQDLSAQVSLSLNAAPAAGNNEFMFLLTVFVLACFVGYYIIWKVTPALHSPLMSVTNAVSSVIIVGALIAAGPAGFSAAKILGFLAVFLASVNIFGGFAVTERMLALFKKKKG